MFSPTLLTSLILALSLPATTFSNPVPEVQVVDSQPSISIARRLALDVSNGVSVADADRARAKGLLAKGQQAAGNGTVPMGQHRRATSFTVTNNAVTYLTSVSVGNPATKYTLVVDSGSSNTWVGAGKAYVKTKTSVNTNQPVAVSYGSGSFKGTEYLDTVTLTTGLVAVNQSIGVASSSNGFSGVDGILGIGPTALTQGSLTNSKSSLIPTVPDTLSKAKTISTEVIGVSFVPTTSSSSANGELTFGGTDSAKFTGSINYTPITKTSPASYYWGIDQTVYYGTSSTPIMAATSGIVDTGTTLILLPTNSFSKYVTATGATMDQSTGLLTITSANYAKLQSLFFSVSGTKYELTANGQTWPRSLNTYIGGKSGNIYLIVGSIGYSSGTGLDFINGYAFLERFYSVFDTTNKRVGLATTSYTKATTN